MTINKEFYSFYFYNSANLRSIIRANLVYIEQFSSFIKKLFLFYEFNKPKSQSFLIYIDQCIYQVVYKPQWSIQSLLYLVIFKVYKPLMKKHVSQLVGSNLLIQVKYNSMNKEKDRLIMIETTRPSKNVTLGVVIRKIPQLDSLVEYISNQYGNHIIPYLKIQQLFGPKCSLQKSIINIQEYLNDLKQNQYCGKDQKFYSFIFDQNISFPEKKGYDQMLKKATSFSRKYLSTVFTRKSLVETQSNAEYIRAYQFLLECAKNYNSIRIVSQNRIKQLTNYLDLVTNFAEVGSTPCNIVHPQEQQINEIENHIKNLDKLIFEAQQAHNRWLTLGQNVKQIQGYIYKGLHEYTHEYDRLYQKLKVYNNCLSKQFVKLSGFIEQKMQVLIKYVTMLMENMLKQSLLSDEINKQQNMISYDIQQQRPKLPNKPESNSI